MLPCGRGTLLAKSAGFKKLPVDIQIKHEKHAKIYPNTIRNSSQKWCRKILKSINKKITNLAISGSHFGTFCMVVSRGDVFVADLFFGISAGTPQWWFWTPFGRFLAPLGSIWSSLLEWCWHPATVFGTSTFPKNLPELRNCGTAKKMLFKHFTNTWRN